MGSGDELSALRKLSYGVGHISNDLTASMWFSYLLIYLHNVILFSDSISGYMMLLGQVADAVATIFVGFESDRTEYGLFHYGRRKSWHLVGVVCVLCSFPFVFNLCITCENAADWARFLYYGCFVAVFQFGWAATQINHLALIPQLTSSENERVALNSIRYAFTVGSNLFVYSIAYLLFKFNNKGDHADNDVLTREDAPKFMYLTFIILGTGILTQLIFHLGTVERYVPTSGALAAEEALNGPSGAHVKSNKPATLDWLGYLKCYRFYLMALLYMSTRLIVNMTQVYFPMYLTDTLELDKSSIALVPLISYISGFLATFPLRYLNRKFGSYATYFIGTCLIGTSCVFFWYHDLVGNRFFTTIVTAVFLGSGSTVIIVASLSLTAELIGANTGSGAFVFGSMSFVDKLSNGIAVALLQQFSPCQAHSDHCVCSDYYHQIMSFLPAGCGALSVVALVLLFMDFRRRSEITRIDNAKLLEEESVAVCRNAIQHPGMEAQQCTALLKNNNDNTNYDTISQ